MSTFFRNTCDLVSLEGEHVDQGALWQLKDGLMVLVDDDIYITAETYMHDTRFERVGEN